jgi:PiT family inorganic phosphate transporter
VLTASLAALPVSTTHVSVGALFGIGATRRDARGKAIASILLSWLVTAPVALVLAALLQAALTRI